MRGWFAKILWGFLIVVFFFGAFMSFGRGGSGPAGGRGEAGTTAPAVVVRVNGEKVERAQFNSVLGQQLQYAQYFGGGDTVSKMEQTKQQALDQVVDRVAQLQASKRERIHVRGREVDEKIEDYVKQEVQQAQMKLNSPKLFDRQIRKEFGSLDKFKGSIRQGIAVDKVKEQVRLDKLERKIKDGVHVDEQDYQDSTLKIKARLIMSKPAPAPPSPAGKGSKEKSQGPSESERKAAARKDAEDLLKQIKAGGDFAAIAKAHSDDFTTAPKGGGLGEVGPGEKAFYYGDEFDKVAFKLKPGEVSGVFEGEDAYYIVKVESRKYNLPKDYSDVKYKCLNSKCKNEWTAPAGAKTCPKCKEDKVRQVGEKKKDYVEQLKSQREYEVWSKYTQKLKEKAKVEIIDPELKAYKKQMEMKSKEAIRLYEQALTYADRDDPFVKSPPIHYNLATLLSQDKKIDEAIGHIRQALAVDETAELHMELAKLLRDKGDKKDKKESLDELRLAAQLADQEPTIHSELAYLLRSAGETKLAAEEEKKAKQNPGGGMNVMPGGF